MRILRIQVRYISRRSSLVFATKVLDTSISTSVNTNTNEMPNYTITEPHPHVTGSRISYGRGGAGNFSKAPKNITSASSAAGPASRVPLTHPNPDAVFFSGRGGNGNQHKEKERRVFSFDEELAEQRRLMEHQAPVYHIGRGGAGNLVDENQPRSHRQNSTSSNLSSDSNSSTHRGRSSLEGAWHRVSRSFSRH